jgi:glucose/arabinose dehydrogenase
MKYILSCVYKVVQIICVILAVYILPDYSLVIAQNAGSGNMNPMNHGPFVSSTIALDPDISDEILVYKGIAVKLDYNPDAVMTFDTDLLRVAGAWTGGFLHWYPARDGLQEWPSPDGNLLFRTSHRPGWTTGSFNDPRPIPYGPLPRDWGHYNGKYQQGNDIVFSYSVNGNEILEKFDFSRVRNQPLFTRTINIDSTDDNESLSMLVLQVPEGRETDLQVIKLKNSTGYVRIQSGHENRFVAFRNIPEGAEWSISRYHLTLDLPEIDNELNFEIAIGSVQSGNYTQYITSYLEKHPNVVNLDLRPYTEPENMILWEELQTEAIMEQDEEGPFVVDEITLPRDNPWNSHLRLADLDFMSDGRAVVANLSGDIWIVDGIKESLDTLSWKRFATGLNQPLGLRVVNDLIYVTGRDQITVLHDRNGNGEADFYENFNNEVMAATNFHAFNMNLETDSEGNFYFAKATPWPPVRRGISVEFTPHHGVLFKLSPDGKNLEVVATGLRNPNGLGISPEDELVYADNEGNWIPTNFVQRIRLDEFHGFVPSAHTVETVPGFPEVPTDEDFKKPISWVPYFVDNSTAKPTFITSETWPVELQGHLLVASYGRGHLSILLNEEVEGEWQGAQIVLPLAFQSGLERGRFHSDGHFYLAGMTNWSSVSAGNQWGSFHRVRYTGQPLRMPVEVNTKIGGIEIRFSDEIDIETASDIENYNLEKWTYTWNSSYGSRQGLFSLENRGELGPDLVEVTNIQFSEDQRSVFLEIPGFNHGYVNSSIPILDDLPHQIEANLGKILSIEYNIKTLGGKEMNDVIYKTIHRVANKLFDDSR